DAAAGKATDPVAEPADGERNEERRREAEVAPRAHTAPLCGAVETNGMPNSVEKATTKMARTSAAATVGEGRRVTRRWRNPTTMSQVRKAQVSSGSHAQ